MTALNFSLRFPQLNGTKGKRDAVSRYVSLFICELDQGL